MSPLSFRPQGTFDGVDDTGGQRGAGGRRNPSVERAQARKSCLGPVLRLMLMFAGGYVFFLLLMIAFENSIVYPAPRYPVGQWEPPGLQFEEFVFRTEDDVQLTGWLMTHPEPRHVIIYCHGNAENVALAAPLLDLLRRRYDATVFCFDYRGYGKSEGSPSEAGLRRDGRAAMQWLCRHLSISPDQVVVIGRSLGAAVALEIAVAEGAGALVLDSAFSSAVDVAKEVYWFLPVGWLMRNRYESIPLARQYRGPLLQTHGDADSIVAIRLGRKLFEAFPGETKEFVVLPGMDHNDWPPELYWQRLQQFLQQLRDGQ